VKNCITGLTRLSAVGVSLAIIGGCAGQDSMLTSSGKPLDCQTGESLVCRGQTATKIKASLRSNGAHCTCESEIWVNRQ